MARKTRIDQIAAIDLEMEQLENRKKALLAAQKSANEKARTHRLCKRHGLFESMLPDAITLTEENFKAFLQKTVANDFGKRTLQNLLAEQERAAAANAENAPKATATTANASGETVTKPTAATSAEKPETNAKAAS